MNLNAIWNPASIGGYQWSRFLPVQEQLAGQYDGFNYLGLGILAGFFTLPVILLFLRKSDFIPLLKRNLFLLLLCLGLGIFAISNAICFNGELLYEIVLPHRLIALCSIFRASSRMFYPVYYIIMLFVLRSAFRLSMRSRAAGLIALVLICSLQLIDLSGVVLQKHAYMASAQTTSIYDELPEDILDSTRFDTLIPIDVCYAEQRTLAVVSGKLGYLYAGNIGSSTNVNCPQAAQLCKLANENLNVGKADATAVYATTSQGLFDRWKTAFEQSDQDMAFFQVEPFYFAVPGISDCK